MRITLSQADSARWASSPADAFEVEETILAWAETAQIEEPVVVVTSDGKTAFAFCVDRGEP